MFKKKKTEKKHWEDIEQNSLERIQNPYLPEGLYPEYIDASGGPIPINDANFYFTTGTNPYPGSEILRDPLWTRPLKSEPRIDVDALWEQLYNRMLAVIVQCSHCGTPQVIDNMTCMQCGAPLPLPTPRR